MKLIRLNIIPLVAFSLISIISILITAFLSLNKSELNTIGGELLVTTDIGGDQELTCITNINALDCNATANSTTTESPAVTSTDNNSLGSSHNIGTTDD